MSSNYRTGTLNLVLSENRNSDYSTISNKWKNTLQLYNKLKKFELNFSILSTDPNISNLFYKFLLSKESKLSNSCLEKIVNFQFKFNNEKYNIMYDIYEFHILLLKIYYFKYCFFQIIPENLKSKMKIKDDPNEQELLVEQYEYEDEDINSRLSTPTDELQTQLLSDYNILNGTVDGGRKKKSNIYTGNGDQKNTLKTEVDIYKLVDFTEVDIYKLVDFIVKVNKSSSDLKQDDSYSNIIDMCICKELFNCEITSTGGNRINKIHKSLKELKTYAKKINITCSNKNKSELFKAIKQINLNNLKIDELKEYCKFFNIKGYSKYKNKKSLIKFINEHNI